MISVKEAEAIHKILIDSFGGAHGIRDIGVAFLDKKNQIIVNVSLAFVPAFLNCCIGATSIEKENNK